MNIEKKLKKLNLELTSSPDNAKIKNDYQIILTAFRLKKAREKAGFTSAPQAYLFHGWRKLPYTRHESGTKSLDRDSAQKCARAYGVTPDWLLNGN